MGTAAPYYVGEYSWKRRVDLGDGFLVTSIKVHAITPQTLFAGTPVQAIRGVDTYRLVLFADGRVAECSRWDSVSEISGVKTYLLDDFIEEDQRVLGFDDRRNALALYQELPMAPGTVWVAKRLGFSSPLEWPRTCPGCGSLIFRYQPGNYVTFNVSGPDAGSREWFDGNWWCAECAWTPPAWGHWGNRPLIYRREDV